MAGRKLRSHSSAQGFASRFQKILRVVPGLFRRDAQLLRAELREKLGAIGLGVALTIGAAVLFMTAVILLFVAAIAALVEYGFSLTAAILIVTGALLVCGMACLYFGLRQLQAKNLIPSKSIARVQHDVEKIKSEVESLG